MGVHDGPKYAYDKPVPIEAQMPRSGADSVLFRIEDGTHVDNAQAPCGRIEKWSCVPSVICQQTKERRLAVDRRS
jgi:hypothetical protein